MEVNCSSYVSILNHLSSYFYVRKLSILFDNPLHYLSYCSLILMWLKLMLSLCTILFYVSFYNISLRVYLFITRVKTSLIKLVLKIILLIFVMYCFIYVAGILEMFLVVLTTRLSHGRCLCVTLFELAFTNTHTYTFSIHIQYTCYTHSNTFFIHSHSRTTNSHDNLFCTLHPTSIYGHIFSNTTNSHIHTHSFNTHTHISHNQTRKLHTDTHMHPTLGLYLHTHYFQQHSTHSDSP